VVVSCRPEFLMTKFPKIRTEFVYVWTIFWISAMLAKKPRLPVVFLQTVKDSERSKEGPVKREFDLGRAEGFSCDIDT